MVPVPLTTLQSISILFHLQLNVLSKHAFRKTARLVESSLVKTSVSLEYTHLLHYVAQFHTHLSLHAALFTTSEFFEFYMKSSSLSEPATSGSNMSNSNWYLMSPPIPPKPFTNWFPSCDRSEMNSSFVPKFL